MSATAETIARADRRAADDPRFARAVLELVEAPTTAAGSYSHVAAVAVNRERLDDARDRFRSAALSTADTQRLLGLGTPQAVHRLRSRGRILGRTLGNTTWFPAWQFQGGERRADLDQVIGLLARFTDDAIAADRIMRLERPELGDRSILDTLDDGAGDRATAWNLLAALGS